MYLYPSRLQETSWWLDEEWQLWQETPAFQNMGEDQLMETFLAVMMGVGSSIDRGYIDAWYSAKNTRKKMGEKTYTEIDNAE